MIWLNKAKMVFNSIDELVYINIYTLFYAYVSIIYFLWRIYWKYLLSYAYNLFIAYWLKIVHVK